MNYFRFFGITSNIKFYKISTGISSHFEKVSISVLFSTSPSVNERHFLYSNTNPYSSLNQHSGQIWWGFTFSFQHFRGWSSFSSFTCVCFSHIARTNNLNKTTTTAARATVWTVKREWWCLQLYMTQQHRQKLTKQQRQNNHISEAITHINEYQLQINSNLYILNPVIYSGIFNITHAWMERSLDDRAIIYGLEEIIPGHNVIW